MHNKKILVITPIAHLDNVKDILLSIPETEVKYLPNCDEVELKKNSDTYAIFTNPNKSTIFLGEKNLSSFDKLEFICTASTGTVHIDKGYCKKKGITVISLTEERNVINKIPSTAEHAFALMLSSIRNINSANKSVREGKWDYESFIGRQLKSLTIGVIGFGRLGTFFSNYCDAFGAKVIVYDPYKSVNHPRILQTDSLETLASLSDVVSLHVHVTDETNKMINKNFLKLCKESLLIVNTSRGEIVDELELINFLKKNKNAKYSTDVLSSEIHGTQSNPLIEFIKTNEEQILITPHIGGMTIEAQNMAFSHSANLLKKAFSK